MYLLLSPKALFSKAKGFKLRKLKEYDGNNINEKIFLDGLFTRKYLDTSSMPVDNLERIKFDVLKIDADFFRGIDSVDRGLFIVTKVIELAKKLDMKIVAEGIESREQVDFLATQDCDLIQGYYFAKPMSVDEFEEKYN